ncbi:MAG TPA: hypothetical protein ENN77_01335, partial [Candidatus Wirthbacteria bacterium]|nr:hypothetical protein [Candidatus Wirthbacteria bacterium]
MEILGHQIQLDHLNTLLSNKQLPQAVLFFGSAGIGKGLIAAELARQLNCQDQRDSGCDCRSCQLFAKQSHPDSLFLESGETNIIKKEEIDERMMPFVSTSPYM